jgi:hypothetical protein
MKSDDPLAPFRRMMKVHSEAMPVLLVFPRIVLGLGTDESTAIRRRAVRGIVDEAMAFLSSVLRKGQEDGLLSRDFDPEDAALHFWGILVSATIRWLLTEGEFDIEKYKRHAWGMFRKIVLKDRRNGQKRTKRKRKSR